MTNVFVYEYVTALGARGIEPLAPSLLAEGRAMRDAVIADFAAISDVQVLTIPCEDEDYFRRSVAESDFALVIAPETAGILEERCRWVMEAGSQLLNPSLEAIRLTSDKLALAEHFQRCGVPHPRTWPLGNEPADLFPVVWKPRDGAGSQRTYLVQGCDESHDLAASMIAQEYVPGIAASVAFLIGANSRAALAPCRQYISADGHLSYLGGSLPLLEDLAIRAVALATRAIESINGLSGYLGVDLVLGDDPRNDCIIEINPRLTTSYAGLRRSAHFNIAEELLRLVRGEETRNLTWRQQRTAFLSDGSVDGL